MDREQRRSHVLRERPVHRFTRDLRLRRDSCWLIHEDTRGALWFGTDEGCCVTIMTQCAAILWRMDLQATTSEWSTGSAAGSCGWERRRGWPVGTACGSPLGRSVTDWPAIISARFTWTIEERPWIGTHDGGLVRLRDGVFEFCPKGPLPRWRLPHSRRRARQLPDEIQSRHLPRGSRAVGGRRRGADRGGCFRPRSAGRTGCSMPLATAAAKTAAAKTLDGKLWFPTQDGVPVIDKEAVPQ